MTRLLDEAGMPLMLVGDSLGMVVLGYPDTTHVTMAEMEHHVRAAARAKPRALLAADLPYRSYDNAESAPCAMRNASSPRARKPSKPKAAARFSSKSAPSSRPAFRFLGHLGHVAAACAGGRRLPRQRQKGARTPQLCSPTRTPWRKPAPLPLFWNSSPPPVAKEVTQRIPVPTIGIGAGPDCDGQILVTPDLLGMLPWFSLKHVKPKLNAAEQMRAVVNQWRESLAKP